MTSLAQLIEEMRVRLAETSTNETVLVRSLSDALRRIDEKLLRDVRNVTIEHETRRAAILGEMQNLAARLCSLPVQQVPQIESVEQQQYPAVTIEAPQANGVKGDWRQAARNIEEALEYPYNAHLPTH